MKREKLLFNEGIPYPKYLTFKNAFWALREIKYGFQRMLYGYAAPDVWNIDSWFLCILPRMLKELKETTRTFPEGYEEITNLEDWKKILEKMIFYFENAICGDDSFDSPEAISRKSKIAKGYKNDGFEMFKKYFYDLWD